MNNKSIKITIILLLIINFNKIIPYNKVCITNININNNNNNNNNFFNNNLINTVKNNNKIIKNSKIKQKLKLVLKSYS